MDFYELLVEDEEGVRLDSYLSNRIENVSRTYIAKLIKDGLILVNGREKMPKYMVVKGDFIEVRLPEKKPFEPIPQDIPLDIIYEDEDIIVVNKPKDMVVHPAPGNEDNTLVNALLFHTSNLSSLNGNMRPGIVHRLDKDTSGLLVVAKNNIAHGSLSNQLKNRSVGRIYIALVHGIVKKDEATINAPIGRSPKNRMKMAVIDKNNKEAISHFRVIERFNKHTLVEVSLETGRTHQIRVHMAYINHPVLGDALYSSRKNEFGIDSQMLHAKTISFTHPRTGEYMEFHSDPPEEFNIVLQKLRYKNRQV